MQPNPTKSLLDSISLKDIPTILPALSPSEQERLLAELDKLADLKKQKICQEKFLAFVNAVWPTFISGRHHAKMAEAFERVAAGKCKRLIINMPPRHRLALDTPVPTPTGWKTIATIQPGDYVFAPDGNPVLVTGKSDVYCERLYEVTSLDGYKVRCDGEHLWTVRFGNHKFQTYNTEQLWRREQGEHLCTTRAGKVVFRGVRKETSENRPAMLPVNEAVKYPAKALPVDPYVLGLWLGDGTNHCGIITSHDDDAAIIRPEIERRGYETTDQNTKMTFGVLGLMVKLREIGVLRNKHIPELYLTS